MTGEQIFRDVGEGAGAEPLPPGALESGPFNARFHAAAEIVGRRWTGAILFALHHGLDRFTDIKRAVPGLSARMLTERLRELEAAGVLERTERSSAGGTRYRLTPKGDDLRPVLIALNRWALRWDEEPDADQPASSTSSR